MKAIQGKIAYHAGRAAEQQVAAHYEISGHHMRVQRWRGHGGEIDLIAHHGQTVVFIEVKRANTHAIAAERLSKRQTARIFAAASEYLSHQPDGQMTDCRFDVALVDAVGRIEIIENALAA